MRSGALRRSVKIQQPSGSDDYNQPTSWADVATCAADVRPMSGRELFEARRIIPEVSHVVTIRYQSGIRPRMRVRYASKDGVRLLQIEAVINEREESRWLRLLCTEKAQA